MVRFLQTSDWQLGMTRHFLEGEAQARYTGARIDAIRTIAEVVRREHCEFVVVAGDVFESNLVSRRTVVRSLEAMAAIPAPVYLLPGNHDPLDAVSTFSSDAFREACPPNVVVLAEEGVHRVGSDAEILAAPWAAKPALTDLAAQALSRADAPRVTRILLAHGPIDVLSPDEDDPARISLAGLEAAIEDGLVHHVALGDKHSRLSVGRSGRIHYSGSPEVTAFRDEAPGDVLVVDVDMASGAHHVTPVRVGTWSFLTLRRHVDCGDDLDGLATEFAEIDPKDRTVVRTAFAGTLSLPDAARLETMMQTWGESLAARFDWQDDIAVVVDPDQVSDLGVGGFVAETLGELAAQAESDRQARDALALLYRLARTR